MASVKSSLPRIELLTKTLLNELTKQLQLYSLQMGKSTYNISSPNATERGQDNRGLREPGISLQMSQWLQVPTFCFPMLTEKG